jgi:ApaG protein
MSDFEYVEESNGYLVKVRPQFIEEESNPEKSFYFFAYHVVITNVSGSEARLASREWVIRDGGGNQEIVKGPGVVGEHPEFPRGSTFEYTSSCPLRTPTGNMRGNYSLVDSEGKEFQIRIPLFYLRHPNTFN